MALLLVLRTLLGWFGGTALLNLAGRAWGAAGWVTVRGLSRLSMTLLGTWLAARFLDRRPFAGFGFHLGRRWWLDFGFGLVLGALLMVGIFLVEWAVGWVRVTGALMADPQGPPFPGALLAALVLYLCVGIYEELYTRGYVLRNLAEGLSFRPLTAGGGLALAWLFSSIQFGVAHYGNPNATLMSTANLVVAGLFLGLGYVLTGELAIPIGLHITWNLFQGNVFGFPVSGLTLGPYFIAITQRGPALWTGGPFGPEGGLMGVLAMLCGAGAILAWVRWRRGRLALETRLAEAPLRG
jgi:hypothetical protein